MNKSKKKIPLKDKSIDPTQYNELKQINENVTTIGVIEEDFNEITILKHDSNKITNEKKLSHRIPLYTKNEALPFFPVVNYITLKMTQVHFENLNSLIDQIDQAKLITKNEKFEHQDNTGDEIYANLFPSLPIVNVIQDKRFGYKVLGGIDVHRIYELGYIHKDDLAYVKEVYPKTKNLDAIIIGGKLKDFQTDPPSQKFLPYRVKIKFYQ